MNRILLLILIACATFLLVLFAVKPELIEGIWLWLVGFAGVIVKGFQSLVSFFKEKLFSDKEPEKKDDIAKTESTSVKQSEKSKEVAFNGVSLSLLRYTDDGQTTLGLLEINNNFYCYTLEDTFHEEKIAGETRIPNGTYPIQFRKEETDLTLRYRERYPEWFKWHLQLQGVPGFDSIYIHNGGDHTDTEGCILVSDSLNVSNEKTFLSNSRETFRRIYGYLQEQLNNNIPARITIYDENWVSKIN
jgi:hypothetical protein